MLTCLTDGRSAPLFVVLAGVGIALLSQQAWLGRDQQALGSIRRTLLARALFFLVLGDLFILVWHMDILHFYAWYVGLAALLFLGASRRGLISGVLLFAAAGVGQSWLRGEAYFADVPYWSPVGMLRDTFLDGIHPVLPWLAFVLFGMWLGRIDLLDRSRRLRVLAAAAAAAALAELASLGLLGLALERIITASPPGSPHLLGTRMCPPGPLYLVSAAATSTVAICLSLEVAGRFRQSRLVRALVSAGQMSLTLYIGHAVVGAGLLYALGALEDHGILFVLGYWLGYYALSVLVAALVRSRFRTGPLEWLMRWLSRGRRDRAASAPAATGLRRQDAPRAARPLGRFAASALILVASGATAAVLSIALFGHGRPGPCPASRPIVVGRPVRGEVTALCRDVWYDLELRRASRVELATFAHFDTYLEVYERGSDAPVLADDDSGPAMNALARGQLGPGGYRVRVRPYRSATGRFELTVQAE